jgi:hypothetical protein
MTTTASYAIQIMKKPTSTYFLNVHLVKLAPLDMVVMDARSNFGRPTFRGKGIFLSRHAGLSVQQGTLLLFIMGRSMLIFGRDILRRNLAWCVLRPNQQGRFHLVFGEIAIYCNLCSFFGLVACFVIL